MSRLLKTGLVVLAALLELTPNADGSDEIAWAGVTSGGAVDAAVSYNPLGSISASLNSTGAYTVTFSGLSAVSGEGGNGFVQAVSAAKGLVCHVSLWSNPSASVQCRKTNGSLANSDFKLVFIPSFNDKRVAFALANQPTASNYNPPSAFSWNREGSIQISRVAIGNYTVAFANHDTTGLMASAYGNTSAICRVLDTALVRCNTPEGQLTDTMFTVASMRNRFEPRAFAYTFKGSADSPNSNLTYNSTGSPVSIQKTATGRYSVNFQGHGMGVPRAHMAMVTSETSGRACSVDTPSNNSGALPIEVECTDFNGTHADSTFYLQMFPAELVRNGGFELPVSRGTDDLIVSNPNLNGWTVEGGQQVRQGALLHTAELGDGYRFLNLFGTGSIYQDIDTDTRVYRLSFKSGQVGPTSKLRVHWGSRQVQVDVSPTPLVESHNLDLPAVTGTTRLRFSASTAVQSGVFLEAVKLVRLDASAACNFSVSPSTLTFDAIGNPQSLTVTNTAGTNCIFDITGLPPWVAPPDVNNFGTRQVSFDPQLLPVLTTSRSATATIAGKPVLMSQPRLCFGGMILTNNIPGSGGTGFVHASPGPCTFTIQPANFITLDAGSSGLGGTSLTFTVAANPSSLPRLLGLSVVISHPGFAPLSENINLSQSGTPCAFSLSSSSLALNSLPLTGLILVTNSGGTGCHWSVSDVPAFVTVTSGNSGTDTGSVRLSIAANTSSSPRSGTMTIAGLPLRVTQAAQTCTYQVAPLTHNVGVGGSAGLVVNVITNSGCPWSVQNVSPQLAITNSGSSGNGTVVFNVLSNDGTTARSSTMTVAGEIVTVNQPAAAGQCTFSLSQISIGVPAAGGNGFSVQVNNTAGTNCSWTVLNTASHVVVRTGAGGGTGSGTVTFDVLATASANPRSTTLVIAGQFLTVAQAGANGAGPVTGGLRFVPLDPCRVMETRPEYNFQGRTGAFGPPFFNTNETRTLNLPVSTVCGIPASAKAFVLNVTVIPRGSGVDAITVFPAGTTRPEYSTVRSPDALIVANSAIVAAGSNAGVNVFASNSTDMIIDIVGYFTDNAAVSNLVFYPLTPCRVVDTREVFRPAGTAFGPPALAARQTRSYRFPSSPFCSIPTGAAAYSVTITVDPNAQPLQFLTTWPSGRAMPNVSSINSPAGRILANSAIVPASSDGSIDVQAFDRTDLILDINGYFAPDDGVNGLFFFTAPQCRVADSSNGSFSGAFGPPIYASESTRTISIPAQNRCSGLPVTAKAFAVNATVLPAGNPMPFLTLYPTGQGRPNASVINAFQGQIVSSAAIIPAGLNGSIDVFAFRQTNVVLEVSGYFDR